MEKNKITRVNKFIYNGNIDPEMFFSSELTIFNKTEAFNSIKNFFFSDLCF